MPKVCIVNGTAEGMVSHAQTAIITLVIDMYVMDFICIALTFLSDFRHNHCQNAVRKADAYVAFPFVTDSEG